LNNNYQLTSEKQIEINKTIETENIELKNKLDHLKLELDEHIKQQDEKVNKFKHNLE
jgi:hypothetical protein